MYTRTLPHDVNVLMSFGLGLLHGEDARRADLRSMAQTYTRDEQDLFIYLKELSRMISG